MTQPKKVLIIAGPNGAGKTTFAREFLITEAEVSTFINADLIAAGLEPYSTASNTDRASNKPETHGGTADGDQRSE